MVTQVATGQWFDSADGQRWWFDSGSIALDFAYTGGFDGPEEWEHWHGPQDLAEWWSDRFDVDVRVGPAAYRRARELRGAIATAALATASDRTIASDVAAVIDRFAAMPDLPPQLRARVDPTSDRLLAVIARDAVLTLAEPRRIRICAAHDCGLVFSDTSRSGSRTWCSMRRCGNRHKVRQSRARGRTRS
jgi:predicted RNA-binding Zn ribbon-like protein